MISIGSKSIPLKEITQKIREEDILSYYFGLNKFPCVISSPLRKDKNPSFSIYYGTGLKLMYYDFGTKEHGSIIDLMMKYFNLPFKETICKIFDDFKSNNVKAIKLNRNRTVVPIHNCILNVKVREWKDYDLEFWNRYGISKEWLDFGKVYPISDIFFERENKNTVVPADKYAYAYVEFKDDKQTIKIYQPYSKKFKWINCHNSSIWDLWEQLPATGERLIITSSRKDALCLWANLGIPSCCMQSESMLPKEHVIKDLISRFKVTYILYDNDTGKETNTGQENAKKLAEKYNLVNICIDNEYGCKDPSDLYKTYGKEIFIDFFKKHIK